MANENYNEPGYGSNLPQDWRPTGDGGLRAGGDGGLHEGLREAESFDGGLREERAPYGAWHSVREESTSELVRDLVSEAQTLLREEFSLARAEMREEAKAAGKASAVLGAGGALAYAGLLTLVGCAVALLSLALPVWASSLIVGAIVLIAGGAMAMAGRERLKKLSPAPERTTETLKENREWLSGTMRDVRSRRRVHT